MAFACNVLPGHREDSIEGLIVQMYMELKEAGLLRGGKLDDQVEFRGSLLRMAQKQGGTEVVRLCMALQRLGPFDAIHVTYDLGSDMYRVRRDTEEFRRERMADSLAECASQELWDACQAAGGWSAVVAQICDMAERRSRL